MERIHQGRSATLSHTFEVDGVATNPSPDTATVTITRADGTALVPAGSVTDAGVGVVTLTLTPAETALLDTLKVTWTATFGGQSQAFTDYVEVAGGFLFSVAQAKAIQGLTNQSTANIVAARTMIETELEGALGYSLVPRYHEETFSGERNLALWSRAPLVGNVPRSHIPFVTTIRSATVDGTALSTASVLPHSAGFYYDNSWSSGYSNIVLRYEHGAKYLLPGATWVGLILAKSWLGGQNRPIDDRAITFNATEGGTYSLAVPGRNGSTFGHPDVDAFVDAHGLNVGVA